jgi:hypothetical protein
MVDPVMSQLRFHQLDELNAPLIRRQVVHALRLKTRPRGGRLTLLRRRRPIGRLHSRQPYSDLNVSNAAPDAGRKTSAW